MITDGARNSPGCDAGKQFALGETVLHQARMHVDGARQRDAVERQLLVMDAIGGKTREQSPDQRDEPDDETQPNHSITRKWVGENRRR